MLEIGMNQVIKNYGFANVLSGASLEIMSGDRVGLVGRNGTGKSTILKIIAGLENVQGGIVTVRKNATVGFLEQLPPAAGAHVPVADVLMEPFADVLSAEARMRALEADMAGADAAALQTLMRQYAHQQGQFESLGGYEIQERFDCVATGFGLTPLLDRLFDTLSGGQKTIVMLARVILRQPDILLLDEPTNHLDLKTLEWFEDYLAKYRGTVVIVSHDRYFLDRTTSKTIVLERGGLTPFHGNYSFSLKERERLLMVEFEQYKNQQKQIEAMRAAIRRFRDWGARADNEDMFKKAHTLEKRLEKMDVLDRPQLEKARIPLAFAGERGSREVLRMDRVALGAGDLLLLEGASLTLHHRDRACLLGDNGSGKTTLIRAILGGWPLLDGRLTVAESAQIGYIPQEIRFADDRATVLEAFRAEWTCAEGEARRLLAKYFFTGENVFKRVSALSGGEKVLLKLAALVQNRINFLILDEPTNHIDIDTRELLEDALLDFGGTILFVSHDRYFLQKLAGRVLTLRDAHLIDYAGGYAAWRAYDR